MFLEVTKGKYKGYRGCRTVGNIKMYLHKGNSHIDIKSELMAAEIWSKSIEIVPWKR